MVDFSCQQPLAPTVHPLTIDLSTRAKLRYGAMEPIQDFSRPCSTTSSQDCIFLERPGGIASLPLRHRGVASAAFASPRCDELWGRRSAPINLEKFACPCREASHSQSKGISKRKERKTLLKEITLYIFSYLLVGIKQFLANRIPISFNL
ncbi:hypothetical protein L211DRAFT_412258 [Terfezia boudieri ATCC MYA-4762]|uniref:Uncharacterized protein n=1 Tax=Terfezia boudieri ATCC MYA-4762 TaxID=1051890 RepID=A0A3N4LKE4_9PEZI|nr:hypothetical protein L211DRAFT_412258 [Terfezia boudieri ATCC MYA-4762]